MAVLVDAQGLWRLPATVAGLFIGRTPLSPLPAAGSVSVALYRPNSSVGVWLVLSLSTLSF